MPGLGAAVTRSLAPRFIATFQAGHLRFQSRQLISDDLPDEIEVHVEVVVHDAIAQSDDLAPQGDQTRERLYSSKQRNASTSARVTDRPRAGMSGDPSGPSRPPPAAAGRVGSAVGRAVAALALASTRRPLATVVISLLLAAAGTLYTLHALTFVTSNLRLLPQKASYVVRLKDYQRDFGELNDIVVVVEAASPDRSKAYAARLVAELERQGVARSRITYRVDPAYFEGRALLYLSRDDLIKLRDRLFDYQEFIEGYAGRPTLPQLLAGLNQQIANSMALGFFDVGLRARAARPTSDSSSR